MPSWTTAAAYASNHEKSKYTIALMTTSDRKKMKTSALSITKA